jgi:TRAP-type C4-dicarboxylate transport system permease small subunit
VRLLIKTVEVVVIVMMAAVFATVFAEVAARWLMGRSLVVTEEVGRYLMIWVAMLGVALVAADEGHMRINLLTDSVSPRVGSAIAILADLLVIGFLAVFVQLSLEILPGMQRQGTVTLGISMAWIYAAMPVGGALTLLVVAVRCTRRILRFPRPLPPEER